MNSAEAFLVAMLAIFAIPYLLWRVGRTDYYAPLVVVQIIVGILLGPGMLGALFPDAYHQIFGANVMGALNGLAWWGVMLFVWTAGIELQTRQPWREWRDTGVTAALALGVPLLFGNVVAIGLLSFTGWIGPSAAPWQFVVGIGMSCAVTALPILVLFMERLEMLRQPLGQRVLRYASFDDIAIWGVLAVILVDWSRIGRQASFLALFAACAIAIRCLMRRLPQEDRWYVGLIWLAASGYLADWSGLHFMVGAFLSGAVLDTEWFDQARMDRFRQTILMTAMPVFFLSTGLRTSWTITEGGVAVAAIALLAASVTGKLGGIWVASWILKWPKGEAAVVGWLLQTKALIMIIFVSILLDRDIITSQTFTALLLMAIGSTMLTIPFVAPRWLQLKTSTRKHEDGSAAVSTVTPGQALGRGNATAPPAHLALATKET
jgi:Kef-type K+ transport system membrane component KefB